MLTSSKIGLVINSGYENACKISFFDIACKYKNENCLFHVFSHFCERLKPFALIFINL